MSITKTLPKTHIFVPTSLVVQCCCWSTNYFKTYDVCYRNAVTEKEIKVDGPKDEASQINPDTI